METAIRSLCTRISGKSPITSAMKRRATAIWDFICSYPFKDEIQTRKPVPLSASTMDILRGGRAHLQSAHSWRRRFQVDSVRFGRLMAETGIPGNEVRKFGSGWVERSRKKSP